MGKVWDWACRRADHFQVWILVSRFRRSRVRWEESGGSKGALVDVANGLARRELEEWEGVAELGSGMFAFVGRT